MSYNFNRKISIYFINDTSRQERDYKATIRKQIGREQLNYKVALQKDKTFEEVKTIRDKIKNLKSLLKYLPII